MNKALNYAFCLLKFRPRSEYELRQRLERKGFSEEQIRQTLGLLKQKGFINDEEFARMWVESRINKPLGLRRLREELRVKGISRDLITQILEQTQEKYSEEKLIQDAISRRLDRLKRLEPKKAKQRLYLYLLRRGFSTDRVREAVNQIPHK